MAQPCEWVYAKHPDVRSYDARQRPASEVFEEAVTLVHEIHRLHQDCDKPPEQPGVRFSYNNGAFTISYNSVEQPKRDSKGFYERLNHAIAATIYGSNMQEDAGMDPWETLRLVRLVLAGGRKQPEAVGLPDSNSYRVAFQSVREGRNIPNPDLATVVQARREVIQHAEAMLFLFRTWADRDVPLTERIIKETHSILCKGLPAVINSETATEGWHGIYRNHNVAAGSTTFTHHAYVKREMEKLTKGFNDDIEARKRTGEFDPFYLAADLAQDFVLIHPFADGNGRMSRLLLNAVLMKYAGVVAPIGIDEIDRKEYLRIAQMASELVLEGDATSDHTAVIEHTDFREEEARCTLARFVMGKAVVELRELKKALESGGNHSGGIEASTTLVTHPDDLELPYDPTLQRYTKLGGKVVPEQTSTVNNHSQRLCKRCASINFYEIGRISNAIIPPGAGYVTIDDRTTHLGFQQVFFGDGPEHKGVELPGYYLPQEPFLIRAKPVFDLGTSLVTEDGARSKCGLCSLFAFIDSYHKYDEADTQLKPKRWFLAVLKEIRGDLFLVSQSASWGEDALRRGRIAVTPWWDSRNNPARWVISKDFYETQVNYSFARQEVETCLKQQKQPPAVPIAMMKLIDCKSRRIVPATGNESYVALSYVWGPAARSADPFITEDDVMIESRITRTIEDAMTATIALNTQYLWIDRYCIDQVNVDIKVKQLGTMDKIFSQAWVTILALGSHDNEGLPTVREGRRSKPSASVGKYSFSPLGPSIVTQHRHSKWRSRAWTLQEGTLSPRLLTFTNSQLFLTCRHGTVCEAYPQVSHERENVWTEYYETVQIPQLLSFEPKLAEGPQDDTSFEFRDALAAYCSRDLTYEVDALAACLGVLVASGLESRLGVPRFFSGMTRTPLELKSIATEESTVGAAIGLGWQSDDMFEGVPRYAPEQLDGTVCKAFPSWSWTSCRPGRKIFAHPLSQDRVIDDAIIMHGAVICSEATNATPASPWVAHEDASNLSQQRRPAGSIDVQPSHILKLTTLIVDFSIPPQNKAVREYGRIKNITLDWPLLHRPEFGRPEIRLYPDPRPPCHCHAHLHLPYVTGSSMTEPIHGKAALLFIDNYATVEPRYAIAHFLALRHNPTTGCMYRVGLIAVSKNAEGATGKCGTAVGGVMHRDFLPKVTRGFRDALVEEWNSGMRIESVRIR